MDLSVVFYGTGGSVPSPRRATACVLIRAGGTRVLVDCGEGAQRQMMRSTGLVQVDEILITHLHADHYLGLPGLLKTYDLQDRTAPLRIAGPRGLATLFDALRRVFGKIRYELELVELGRDSTVDTLEGEGFRISAFPVKHRVPANGYALVEDDRPPAVEGDALRARMEESRIPLARHAPEPDGLTKRQQRYRHGQRRVQEDLTLKALTAGHEFCLVGTREAIDPKDFIGTPRPGRKVVITGDTEPCEMTRVAAHGAELLVHDATFSDEDAGRAAETGHSTARQAAELAADARVGMLGLVHVSARYDVGAVLGEAREVFPNSHALRDYDVVEIPFPERGGPRLLERGARQRDRAPRAEGALRLR